MRPLPNRRALAGPGTRRLLAGLTSVALTTHRLEVTQIIGSTLEHWNYVIHFDSDHLAPRSVNLALPTIAVENYCPNPRWGAARTRPL